MFFVLKTWIKTEKKGEWKFIPNQQPTNQNLDEMMDPCSSSPRGVSTAHIPHNLTLQSYTILWKKYQQPTAQSLCKPSAEIIFYPQEDLYERTDLLTRSLTRTRFPTHNTTKIPNKMIQSEQKEHSQHFNNKEDDEKIKILNFSWFSPVSCYEKLMTTKMHSYYATLHIYDS